MSRQNEPATTVAQPMASFWVLAAHLFWFAIGPMILVFLSLKLANSKDGWMSPSDLAFPVVLVSTIAARWYCYRSGDRTNAMGADTTIEQLRRYSSLLFTGGLLLWVIANARANYSL